MRHKLLTEAKERTYALIFDSDDEVMSALQKFCNEENVSAARFTAIGAFRSATLGYFNWDTKEYDKIRIEEQVEVLSMVGDVALHESKPKIHAHVVVGKRDGTAHGGHVLEARVRPTLEVLLIEAPGHLKRTMDRESGLPLINVQA